MKLLMIYLAFIGILVACGPMEEKQQVSTTKIQALSGYMTVKLNKPVSDLKGTSLKMQYRQKEYRVGFKSDVVVLEQLKRLSAGDYTFYVDGELEQEAGHPPNKNQNVDVIQIQELKSP